ncbi:hypothetical protein FPQ18DRAFT_100457 [Pyronema domesticum]|nr:hypothetical protein FPQ18DRAFT_100457 [Pyronema domesticum]
MLARTIRQRTLTAAPSARAPIRTHASRRFNSTSANASAQGMSPLAAGALGGLATLGGGYLWYNMSGTKKVVETAKTAIETAESAKKTIVQATPNKNEIVSFFRNSLGPYLHFIPGASGVFDELDRLAESHGEEVEKVLGEAYEEIKDAVKKGGMDAATAAKVANTMKKAAEQLKELGKDAGQKVLNDNPELKEKVGKGLDKLNEMADEYGPDAKKMVQETYKELEELYKEGATPGGVYKAVQLVKEKTEKVKEMGSKAAEMAWEKGTKEAEPYLEKFPEVKKLVEENMDSLKGMALGGGFSVAMIPKVFMKIREATQGDAKEGAEKLKKYFDEISKEGKKKMGDFKDSDSFQGAAEYVEKYIKSIPGGEEALKGMPSIDEMVNLSKKKGPEAEKLLKETMNDISKVLEKRIGEAKELAKK